VYEHHRAWTRQDFGAKTPSQVFREHVLTCVIDDAAGLEMRHKIGIENICWECDYPHSDSTWPSSPEQLARSLAGIPEDDVHLVTHGNAMRAFQLRSIDLLGRERCTVDALRAQAANVDVTLVSGQGGIPPSRSNEPVTMADAFNQLAAALKS